MNIPFKNYTATWQHYFTDAVGSWQLEKFYFIYMGVKYSVIIAQQINENNKHTSKHLVYQQVENI